MRNNQPIDSQTLVRDAIDSAAFFYSRTQSLQPFTTATSIQKNTFNDFFFLREERRRSKLQHKKTCYARGKSARRKKVR